MANKAHPQKIPENILHMFTFAIYIICIHTHTPWTEFNDIRDAVLCISTRNDFANSSLGTQLAGQHMIINTHAFNAHSQVEDAGAPPPPANGARATWVKDLAEHVVGGGEP